MSKSKMDILKMSIFKIFSKHLKTKKNTLLYIFIFIMLNANKIKKI